MEKRQHNVITRVILVFLGLVVFMGYSMQVEAGLVPQEMSGVVEYAKSADLIWEPLTKGVILEEGYYIRTGPAGSVGLQAEDGSILYISENTQLAITELKFSQAQQMRVSRFKLLTGMLTANVAKVNFEADKNVFEVETPTIVAGFKSTEAQIQHDRDLQQSDVFVFSGIVKVTKIGLGIVNFSGLLRDEEGGNPEGITTPLDIEGASIIIEVIIDKHEIKVKSDLPLPFILVMIGDYEIVEATNMKGAPPINLNLPQKKTLTLGERRKLVIQIASGNEIIVEAPEYIDAVFKFTKHLGDGYFWLWEDCECAGFFIGKEIPGVEIPVIPSEPGTRPPRGTGSPAVP